MLLPSPPAPVALTSVSVSYLGTSNMCPWTLPAAPTTGQHSFTLKDGQLTVTRSGSVNPEPRGRMMAVIAYQPVYAACPTLVNVQ